MFSQRERIRKCASPLSFKLYTSSTKRWLGKCSMRIFRQNGRTRLFTCSHQSKYKRSCCIGLQLYTNDIECLIRYGEDKLISASRDETIRVWNLVNGECEKTLRGHTNSVKCLKLLKNGQLASGSVDSLIKIWSLKYLKINHFWSKNTADIAFLFLELTVHRRSTLRPTFLSILKRP